MKTTEEIIELIEGWSKEDPTQQENYIEHMFGTFGGCAKGFLGGYRTAEAEYSEAIRELVEAIELVRPLLPQQSSLPNVKTQVGEAVIALDAIMAKHKEVNRG